MLGSLIGTPRAALLQSLALGEKSVGELVKETSLSQPNISNHLARLLRQGVVQKRRDGRKIYYSLTDQRVQFFLEEGEVKTSCCDDVKKIAHAYAEALRNWDVHEAERVILRAAASGADWRVLFVEVLLPALKQMGNWWESGEVCTGIEHTATALTERLVTRLFYSRTHPFTADEESACAVIGCAPGDYHALGARMSAYFLEDAGWRVVYLGANVPHGDFISAVERHRPEIALLSVCIKDLEPGALDTIRALKSLGDEREMKVAVGGTIPMDTPIPYLAAGADSIIKCPSLTPDCAKQLLNR